MVERLAHPRSEVVVLMWSRVSEYISIPHTSELVTATFQSIWKERESRVAHLLEEPFNPIANCDRTTQEIAKSEKEGKRLGYLPPELAAGENRHILAAMFPQMESRSCQEGNIVTNQYLPFGWFDYEAAIEAPYLETNEVELRELFDREGRKGINLTQYIVAGQDSKLFTGRNLDEVGTWVRLLGSRKGGRVVDANFSPFNTLYVGWELDPRFHDDVLGGRSVGVK